MNYLTFKSKAFGFSKPTNVYTCICGKEKVIRASAVNAGKVVSCGCKREELLRHASARRASSFHAYKMRWNRLEEIGAKSPSLQKFLDEIAKEYPTYV